ncbi:MAG: bifunctional precorrin-2 dehydrogenase/sirohydrochlorin ferrochelatase [Peptococcaceae bacterium]
MAFTYSVTLNLSGTFCTVVGGGQVALRKVQALLAEGAEVTVISPALIPELAAMQDRFVWMKNSYKDGLLEGSFLVIAATDQRDVNQQIARWCQENQVLVNVVDSKKESNFIVNAAVKQGDLLIAVSTNGISPAVSRTIRQELEQQYGPEYAIMLELIAQARAEAMKTIKDEAKRRQFLQSLADMGLPAMLRQETKEDVEKRVKLCLSSYWD